MRQKRRNTLFTIFYPGYEPGKGDPAKDAISLAVPDTGEFASLCTPEGCAVFYHASDLRMLKDILDEAADLLEKNQAKIRG